jgi:acetylornithine deacetylase/succinyl-diaminopimelate desuccinylase-like protein
MQALGLADVAIDDIGNVYGRRPGAGSSPGLLIAAHLDTVFPIETDLRVRREGRRIYGPGLGDNSLGVAGLLHLAQALQEYAVPQQGDIWFVANVGEEGLGDLRGMRAAVDRLQPQVGAVIALEGCDQGRILHEAIGVRRYRMSISAPGGHSWQNFGTASAVHVLVRLAARLTELHVTREPKSTFNVGVIEGGSSINTIAQHAALLLDLRAAQPTALADLIRQTERIVEEARAAAPQTTILAEIVGDRPAGSIPRSHRLVQLATAAYRSVGAAISYEAGSTDANLPLSRGIPAVCVAIGHGENAHRLDEYIEPQRIPAGMRALLLLALAATAEPA